MRFNHTKLNPSLFLLTSLLLAACGGGGGSTSITGGSAVVVPSAPTGQNAINASGCSLSNQLSWNPSAGATSYKIYRSGTAGVTTSSTNVATVTASPYTDTTVSASSPYFYVVTAVNSAGESAVSSEATVTTSAACSQIGGSTQGTALTLTQDVTTLAGFSGGAGSLDGTGTSAVFSSPVGITTDGVNLYVADTNNNNIRKIVISSGTVTTIAGTGLSGTNDDAIGTNAQFNKPEGITTDGTNLYVADTQNHTIRKIVIATGAVSTLAGVPSPGFTDANDVSARFNFPRGITTDGTVIYVSDTANHAIRKIDITSRAVTTIAGTGTAGYVNHATGTSAQFSSPRGITMDATNLYVADTANNAIRKITIGGTQTVTDVTVGLSFPQGITSDGVNLYITQSNHIISKIVIASSVISLIAGTSATSGSANGNGASARFYFPAGITTDGSSLFAVDSGNHTIRMIQ